MQACGPRRVILREWAWKKLAQRPGLRFRVAGRHDDFCAAVVQLGAAATAVSIFRFNEFDFDEIRFPSAARVL
jgi:hypothetical protein